MLISSAFSSVLKFSEVSLSSYMCASGGRGMVSVIRSSFSKFGSGISYIYAALCLLLSFFMGSALQLSSVIECTKSEFDFSSNLLYAFIIICLFFVVYRGVSFIERFTSFAIPIASIVYVCLAFCCIGLNFNNINYLTILPK